MLVLMKIGIAVIVLSLLSLVASGAFLNKEVMDRLAAQIPRVSTGETTPQDMHEAVKRYKSTVLMFEVEAMKYKIACYRMFFNRSKYTGVEIAMIHGTTPDRLCEHLAKRVQRGYPVPEPQLLLKDIDD